MKTLMERLRGARHIELIFGITLLALLTLMLTNERTTGKIDVGASPLELRLERLLSGIEGVESVRVMITEDENGNARGAVIVTDDVLSLRSTLQIQGAVQTLLEIDASKVNIISRDRLTGGE